MDPASAWEKPLNKIVKSSLLESIATKSLDKGLPEWPYSIKEVVRGMLYNVKEAKQMKTIGTSTFYVPGLKQNKFVWLKPDLKALKDQTDCWKKNIPAIYNAETKVDIFLDDYFKKFPLREFPRILIEYNQQSETLTTNVRKFCSVLYAEKLFSWKPEFRRIHLDNDDDDNDKDETSVKDLTITIPENTVLFIDYWCDRNEQPACLGKQELESTLNLERNMKYFQNFIKTKYRDSALKFQTILFFSGDSANLSNFVKKVADKHKKFLKSLLIYEFDGKHELNEKDHCRVDADLFKNLDDSAEKWPLLLKDMVKDYRPHDQVIHATSEGIISLTGRKYFWLKLDVEQMEKQRKKISIDGLKEMFISKDLRCQMAIIQYLIEEGGVRYPHIFCEIDQQKGFTSNVMKLLGVFKSTRDFVWGEPFYQLYPELSLEKSPEFQIQRDSIFFVQYHSDHVTEEPDSIARIKKIKEDFKKCLFELCNSVKLCLEVLAAHYNITVPHLTTFFIYYEREEIFPEILQEVQNSVTDELSSKIIKSIRIYDFYLPSLYERINERASENIDNVNEMLKNLE